MKFRILVGAGLGLLATACATVPEDTTTPAACASQVAESAAYLEQYVEARKEKLKVIRFASEEAMDAYNYETNVFAIRKIEASNAQKALEKRYDLAPSTATYQFDELTDEEAVARYEASKACALPLL